MEIQLIFIDSVSSDLAKFIYLLSADNLWILSDFLYT